MGRWTTWLVALLALSGWACGGEDARPGVDAGALDAGEGSDATVDAPPPVDGGTPLDAEGPTDAGVDAPTADAGPLTGDTYLYVLDVLDLGVEDPDGVAPGFDLDGTTDRICRQADFTSPAPESMPGVDNSLGPVLAAGEEQFRVREALGLNLQRGALLVLARLRGVDDFDNDERVEVDVLFGVLPEGVEAPMLELDGRYVPGQTFDLDARALAGDEMTALSRLPGAIVDGRLTAGPGMLPLTIPFGSTLVTLDLDRVRMGFDVSETGLSEGVVGGALDVEDTIAALSGVEGLDPDQVRFALELFADLDPASGNSECQRISVALVFDATTAVAGAVVTP